MPAAVAWDAESLEPLTDEELSVLALAADPDPSLDDDAVSFWDLTGAGPDQRLPKWYMPAPIGGNGPVRGWRRRLVILLIASFLLIDAYGLCNIYGWVSFG
jgi:hypothetical protein